MKKTLILLTALSLIGCGSVNKQIQKEETKEEIKQTETVKDSSITETQTEVTSKVNLSTFLSEFNLEPIDNSKPFFVGSQKFENVKVQQKTEQKDFTQDISFLQNQTHYRFLQMEKELQRLTEENKRIRDVKRTDWTWLILLILIFFFIFAWYKLKK
jgi:uncharacterized protein YceK